MTAKEYAKTFKPFACGLCGGNVTLTQGPGRTLELYRGVPELELDKTFPLPQCEQCGEIYVPGKLEDELQSHLRAAFDLLIWKRLNRLEDFLLSSLPRCDVCGKPSTRTAEPPIRVASGTLGPDKWIEALCDDCRAGANCRRRKPSAEMLCQLAKLRGGDG